MQLREENEALMESLVRTKVDLAETEGRQLQHWNCFDGLPVPNPCTG